MQSGMDGGWRLVVVMPGGEFTAQIMTKNAGVESSVSLVSGARQLALQIMANKFDEWSTTALQVRLFNSRVLK